MKFGSVCSGIEAASVAWKPLGWEAAWFSEIEPFPCAVLEHHYPNVPNLGDMTLLPERIASGEIEAPDIICGGTPCQSWSVAGKRGGRDDPRGELTFSFLEIVRAAKPMFVVWENVPGLLSTNNGTDFADFLDELLSLGYIINCDILDAQNFGVAQRRRRIFVVCQRANILMSEKSRTSSTIGAMSVLKLLQIILGDLSAELGKKRDRSDLRCENVIAGLNRTMRPFLVQSDDLLNLWLNNLADVFLNAAKEPKHLELNHGHGTEMEENINQSEGIPSSGLQEANPENVLRPSLSTSQSLKKALEDLLNAVRLSTTSTELRAITESKISIYAEMLNIIGKYIARLNFCCPHSQKAASLYLTVNQEYMNYARQFDEQVFRDERVYGFWSNFGTQARETSETVASAREGFDPAAVLFEFEGVRRDSAPSRETGEDAPRGSTQSLATSSGRSPDGNETIGALLARDYKGFGNQDMNDGRGLVLQPSYGIAGNIIGREPHNGGNGLGFDEEISYTLTKTDQHGVAHPIPFQETADCLTAAYGTKWNGNASATNGSLFAAHPIAYAFDSLSSNSMKSDNPNSGCNQVEVSRTIDTSRGLDPSCNQGGVGIVQPIVMRESGQGYWMEDDKAGTLRAEGENRPSRPSHVIAQPIASTFPWQSGLSPDSVSEELCGTLIKSQTMGVFQTPQQIPYGVGESPDIAHCLRAEASKADKHESTTYVAQPIGTDCYNGAITGDVACTMGTSGSSTNASGPTVMHQMAVRRLTPVECERLQGFPDGYTMIPWRKKPAEDCPDGPRYKALGNSWAVPNVHWIGQRIQAAIDSPQLEEVYNGQLTFD